MQAPNLPRWLADLGQVLLYSARRFLRDGGLQTAAALSYSSLLALVPALFIVLETMIGGYTERWQLFLGVILLGVVLFARGGVIGLLAGRARHD